MASIIINRHNISSLIQRLVNRLPQCYYLMGNHVLAILDDWHTPYHGFGYRVIKGNAGDNINFLTPAIVSYFFSIDFIYIIFVNAHHSRHFEVTIKPENPLQVMHPR